MQFMVEITLPQYKDEDYIALMPKQRKVINNLLSESKILIFSLDLNRTSAWMIFFAKTEEEVLDIVSAFPLYHYLEVKISPLAVFESGIKLPPLVLN